MAFRKRGSILVSLDGRMLLRTSPEIPGDGKSPLESWHTVEQRRGSTSEGYTLRARLMRREGPLNLFIL